MEMYGPLARRAALFVLLLCFVHKTHGRVKIVLSLLCLICLCEFGRLVFGPLLVNLHSRSQSDAMSSQPKPVELELASDKKTSQPKAVKPKELEHALDNKTSQPEALKPIELELAIDKKNNQVLYAESKKDFVDVLVSFLTLPLGTIIRLADKKSGIGCMDELYKSVQAFDEECFPAKTSKTMLLNPRSACGLMYNKLAVKVDETDYTILYVCRTSPCLNSSLGLVSLVKNSICACGKAMDKKIYLQRKGEDTGRGFTNDEIDRYIIRDDLLVLPASVDHTLSWLRRKGIKDSTEVKMEIVKVGLEDVLHLLQRSMISTTPLTDVFKLKDNNNILSNSLSIPYHCRTVINDSISKEMEVKLWFNKSSKEILCVEAEGADFVDFLFTFLTFPLGAIIKMFEGHSSMGSVDQLYESAHNFSDMQIISTECTEMLLSPKLERMFGCSNQLLQIEEKTTPAVFDHKNCSCSHQEKYCLHLEVELKLMNPKRPGETTTGGCFIKGRRRLLVTDKLEIKRLSTVSDIHKLGNTPLDDMESTYVRVGEEEALNLLQASLISKSVLSHAFSARVINRSEGSNYY